MNTEVSSGPLEPPHVFPPALVRLVRERMSPSSECLRNVTDRELVQLFTTTFFAGLETHEGEHHPVGVVFLGHSRVDFVMAADASVAPRSYRWKILRFASPRPFANRELVKLAVAGADRRIYSAVSVLDGRLLITGLAREGVHTGSDPFMRVVASRPGCLSIRGGRDLAIEYERGVVVTVGDEAVLASGPVHRALETIARSAGVDEEVVSHYLDAVAFLVREMVAHGRGGILIISPDDHPSVAADSAPYRIVLDSSLGVLLRLAWRIRGTGADDPRHSSPRVSENDPLTKKEPSRSESVAFGALLRSAFLTETERVVEEIGRLTAIDGAVLLDSSLGLVAFGVILPVRQQIDVVETTHDDVRDEVPRVDLGSRGTRHRAGATYAAEHPGSVVFVASEDGQVSCLLRERDEPVRLWRLMAGTAHGE